MSISLCLNHFLIDPFYIMLPLSKRKSLLSVALNISKDFSVLSKKIGCSAQTLRYFNSKDQRYIKAKFLKKLLYLTSTPPSQIEEFISIKRGCSNHPLDIKLPLEISSDLSFLIAKSMGDGGIASDLRFHYTNSQYNLIREVIASVKKALGKTEYHLQKRVSRGTYDLKFPSVVGFILNYFGAPLVKKLIAHLKYLIGL